jgi:hypothetical protein
LHWHEDHRGACHNPRPSQIGKWAENFDRLADQLERNGVQAINATAETALRLWPRMDIADALNP